MVKTHPNSSFVLYSLSQIRDTPAVVLQIEDTRTCFESGSQCYLCEIVPSACYDRKTMAERLTDEIVNISEENRRQRKKITRLEACLKKAAAKL